MLEAELHFTTAKFGRCLCRPASKRKSCEQAPAQYLSLAPASWARSSSLFSQLPFPSDHHHLLPLPDAAQAANEDYDVLQRSRLRYLYRGQPKGHR